MVQHTKRGLRLLLTLLIVAAPFVLWSQRWKIHDAVKLRGYNPPVEIQQLATDSTLNDSSRRLFYVYHPSLDGKESFNEHCNVFEKTIVLGCYVSGRGIYLYDVKDERLNGVEQVTAGHEMLHAAYERLSSKERKRVNGLLEAAFASITDARIKNTIEDYRKNGADVNNELHSILGTEVRNLPAELESYYSRYFTNRVKVVEYSEKYEQAFTELKQKVASADAQLKDWKQQIDSNEAKLNTSAKELEAERARLDALLAAKNYEAYNAAVPGFNAKVSAYNSLVAQTRRLIDQFNALVAERNATATEENELFKAIDSRPSNIQAE